MLHIKTNITVINGQTDALKLTDNFNPSLALCSFLFFLLYWIDLTDDSNKDYAFFVIFFVLLGYFISLQRHITCFFLDDKYFYLLDLFEYCAQCAWACVRGRVAEGSRRRVALALSVWQTRRTHAPGKDKTAAHARCSIRTCMNYAWHCWIF